MIFDRHFKFYASHRNQLLNDKCACLHGHRYEVNFQLQMKRDSGMGQHVTILFADLDFIGESIRDRFDHACLLDYKDPLLLHLRRFVLTDQSGPNWKFALFPFPTSAENLAWVIFDSIARLILNRKLDVELNHISLRETDSTLVSYNRSDWELDCNRFRRYDFNLDHECLSLKPTLADLDNIQNYIYENWGTSPMYPSKSLELR